MTVDFCDPNGTNTGEWQYTGSSTHHENVDDAIRQPTNPNLDDNNNYADGDQSDIEDYSFTSLTVTEVTSVRIWYMGGNAYAHMPEVRIYMGGWTAQQTADLAGVWRSLIFNGTWSQEDLNGLRVEWQAPSTIDKFEVGFLYAVYAEVTYTLEEEGYGHDFMGVPAANIDSVNGIPSANIDTIKGV